MKQNSFEWAEQLLCHRLVQLLEGVKEQQSISSRQVGCQKKAQMTETKGKGNVDRNKW